MGPTRRSVVTASAGGLGLVLLGSTGAAARPGGHPGRHPGGRLRDVRPEWVGLDPRPIEEAQAAIRGFLEPQEEGFPFYAGAVGLMGHRGALVAREVCGHALRYATGDTELPREQWVPTRRSTIYDLASVSKLFTSLVAVQLIEEGRVRLEDPVARHLPEFGAAGKEAVTVQHLLTHTSGFVPTLPLWSDWDTKEERIAAVMSEPLDDPPGTTYRYSDLNLIALGCLVERLRGQPLDRVVRQRITGVLGLRDTGYNPGRADRCAATEYQADPARGMVRGEVHDENAWSLGGVAGHAGVFSTADDLAVLAQALLDGGAYRGRRILTRESVELLITNFTPEFPEDSHGLGFELDQPWYMGEMSSPRTAGHTGYTGTSIVIDFSSRSFAILLTNRVHPSRDWGSINPAREAWANGLARARRRGAH